MSHPLRPLSCLLLTGALLSWSGCLFTEEAATSGDDNGDNSSAMEDDGVGDLPDMPDDEPDEGMTEPGDLGAPDMQPADMGEPEEDMTAPPADMGAPDMPPPGCMEPSDCPPTEGCVDGECVDLLYNDDHCGAPNRACPQGSECFSGMCLCPNLPADAAPMGNYTVVASSETGDGLRRYPAPLLAPYRRFARYDCAMSSCVAVEELSPREDYPPQEPHYIALFTSGAAGISFKVLDEWGQQAQANVPTLQGNALKAPEDTFDETHVGRFEVSDWSANASLLWVLWFDENAAEGDPAARIRPYLLQHKTSDDVLSIAGVGDLNLPTPSARGIYDFSTATAVRQGMSGGGMRVTAVAAIEADSDPLADEPLTDVRLGVYARVHDFDAQGGMSSYEVAAPRVELGEVRQIANGFDIALTTPDDNTLLLHVTPLVEIEDSRAKVGQISGQFERYTFKASRSSPGERFGPFTQVSTSPIAFSDGTGQIPKVITELSVGFSGDFSEFPPPMASIQEQGRWFHMAWIRSIKTGETQSANFDVWRSTDEGTAERLQRITRTGRGVYDWELIPHGDAPFPATMAWLEADLFAGAFVRDASELNFTTITKSGEDIIVNATSRYFGKPFGAHRISTAQGTRAAGVLVHGQLQRNQYETRFYAFGEGRIACGLAPPRP